MFPESCIPADHVEPRHPQELDRTATLEHHEQRRSRNGNRCPVSRQAARKPGSFLTRLQLFFTLPTVNARRLGGSLFIEAGVACA
jgi:hypothetical protein